MGLDKHTYNIFKEGRPRTVNKDVEDIKKGQYIYKGDDASNIPPEDGRGKRATRREAPKKLSHAELPADVKSMRSSFEEGKVHEIWFRNIPVSQTRKYFVSYRKLTQQDFDKIYKSNKYNLTAAKIFPTEQKEHAVDIYYLKKDMGIPIEKDGFFSLSEKDVEEIKKDYPNYFSKLEPVSIEDISNGINLRYYEFDNIKSRWALKKANLKKDTAKSDKALKKASDTYANLEDRVGTFLAQNDDLLNKVIGLYNDINRPGKKPNDLEELKDFLEKYTDRYLDRLSQEDKEVVARVLGSVKQKLSDKKPLFNTIMAKYSKKDDIKTAPEEKEKKEPETKKTVSKTKSQKNIPVSDIKKQAELFMGDSKNIGLLNSTIDAYSKFEDKVNYDKEERDYQLNLVYSALRKLFTNMQKHSNNNAVRDYIVKDLIKNKISDLAGDDGEAKEVGNKLYELINNALEGMKQREKKQDDKQSLREAEEKKYAIELKPDSQSDKLYASKKVPKVFGSKNTYLRRLSSDQVKTLNRNIDVISVKEVPSDTKGYTKASTSFRDAEKGSAVRFDPKNPKDVANLTGKVKPGEKLYSVNIKVGDGKAQDVLMPLSKIEELVPDLKFGKDIKQPFEKELYRDTSKTTGQKIYDKVKGVLSFNSTEPIDAKADGEKVPEKPKSSLPPEPAFSQKIKAPLSYSDLTYRFYVVDLRDKENYPNGVLARDEKGNLIGSNDKEEAKVKWYDYLDSIGSLNDTSNAKVYQQGEIKVKRVALSDKDKAQKGGSKNYKFFLIDDKGKPVKDESGKAIGSDSKEEAEKLAKEKGSNIKVVSREQILQAMSSKKASIPQTKFGSYVSTWGKEIKEALSKEDETKLKSQKVSFTIESDPNDFDKTAQVSGKPTGVVLKNNKLAITLEGGSKVIFDGSSSNGIFIKDPSKDANTANKVNNVSEPLKGVVDNAFKKPADDSKLEAYIRTRIRQAIQEAEISQYWGSQGPDVKKKRLEEYMKKYEWGFQNSEDPYVRSNGSEKHAIVTKLVHELGDEGVAIFNSYAPKGQEIARPDDLNDMADSPLGSQMARPFEPNTLTMRGGRVAEENGEAKYDSLYNQAKRDVENKYKDIEDLAAGYNRKDREIERSPSLKKNIEKLISQEYGKDASKASPELKKAFMGISDKDLKSSI